MFWLLAGMLLGGAVVLLFYQLLSTRPGQLRVLGELRIYREKLAWLHRERQQGRLPDEQEESLRRDLERTLLQALGEEAMEPPRVRLLWPALGLVALLPLFVVVLYMELGTPQLAQLRMQGEPLPGTADRSSVSPDERVKQLGLFLQQQPDHVDAWFELAELHMGRGQYSEAAQAAERLHALRNEDPRALLLYADALAMAHGGRLRGRPAELVAQALVLAPNDKVALWLSGMAAREQGDSVAALRYWRQLEPVLEGEELDSLQAMIQDAAASSQEEPEASLPTAGEGAALLQLEVSLHDSLQEQVQPEDAVYIFARAPSGPPMPVAVMRKQVRDLPLRVTLDDSMAIMPTQRLSAFDQVQAGARISFSGDALARSGDLLATPVSATVGAVEPVQLVIDHALP